MDENFTLNIWDKLLSQCLITLNLLCGSRINPKLSVYYQVYGAFNFNHTSLDSPGTRVLIKKNQRFKVLGHRWYAGPSINHHQNVKVWITETFYEQDADTLSCLSYHVSTPHASTDEYTTAAAQDLVTALSNPAP